MKFHVHQMKFLTQKQDFALETEVFALIKYLDAPSMESLLTLKLAISITCVATTYLVYYMS